MKSIFLTVSCCISADAVDELSGMLQGVRLAMQKTAFDDQSEKCAKGFTETATGNPCWHSSRSPTAEFVRGGFNIDSSAPSFVVPTRQLFNFSVDSYGGGGRDTKYACEENLDMQAAKIASYFGIEAAAPLGLFKASVGISGSSSKKEYHKMLQCIVSTTIVKETVKSDNFNNIDYLLPDVIRSFNDDSPAVIVRKFGQFYARDLELGGILRSTFSQEKSESETQKEFEAAIKVNILGLFKYKKPLLNGFASTTKSKKSVSMSVTAGGGNASVFDSYLDSTKFNEWMESIEADSEGLQIVQAGLKPLHEIVEKVNWEKGQLVKEYQESTWDEAGNPGVICPYVECPEFYLRQRAAETVDECCIEKYQIARKTQGCTDGYVDIQSWQECRMILEHAAYEKEHDGKDYGNLGDVKGYHVWDTDAPVSGCFVWKGGGRRRRRAHTNYGFYNPVIGGAQSDSARPKICRLDQD